MGRSALQVQPLPSYDEGAAQTLSDLEGKADEPTARLLLGGVREALQRTDLPENVRASLKKSEELGRKCVAAKIALAQRPDYRPEPRAPRVSTRRQ